MNMEVLTATKLADVISGRTLRVPLDLAGTNHTPLASILDACQHTTDSVNAQIKVGGMCESPYLLGRLDTEQLAWLEAGLTAIRRSIPRARSQVFQKMQAIESITASFWSAREVRGRAANDALINMVFADRCGELPLHNHRFSDRVIFVLNGTGFGYFTTRHITVYDSNAIGRVPVERGDILCYPRTTQHTFSTRGEPIELLTYHSEFVPFDDERQYTLLSDAWTPENAARVAIWPRPTA